VYREGDCFYFSDPVAFRDTARSFRKALAYVMELSRRNTETFPLPKPRLSSRLIESNNTTPRNYSPPSSRGSSSTTPTLPRTARSNDGDFDQSTKKVGRLEEENKNDSGLLFVDGNEGDSVILKDTYLGIFTL
jgi:hypothetical protein